MPSIWTDEQARHVLAILARYPHPRGQAQVVDTIRRATLEVAAYVGEPGLTANKLGKRLERITGVSSVRAHFGGQQRPLSESCLVEPGLDDDPPTQPSYRSPMAESVTEPSPPPSPLRPPPPQPLPLSPKPEPSSEPTLPHPLTSILQYTTHAERQAVELYIELGSYVLVADRLGVDKETARRRVTAAKKRAARRGWSPGHDMTKTTPEGFSVKGISTLYGANGQVLTQWVKTKQEEDDQRQAWLEAVVSSCEPFRGTAEPVSEPSHADEDLCVVVPWGDPHAGMLASAAETGLEYNLRQWETDLLRHHQTMIAQAPNAAEGVLANLGDLFHSNNAKNRTEKSGHPLDVSHMWTEVYRTVMRAQRACIEMMRRKFKRTTVINVRGNHDPEAAASLSLAWEMVYENCPDVVISTPEAWFHYYRFGTCLLGFTHGDKTTNERLIGSMAVDRPTDWAETSYRKWYLGHVHHTEVKETSTVYVETYGTIAPADSHAHSAGYRSNRRICMDVLHRERGWLGTQGTRYLAVAA